MIFTENNGQQMWSKMLKENFNVTDNYQLGWVSEYAAFHEIKESALGIGGAATFGNGTVPSQGVSPIYATPLNTTGMGNPMAPGYGPNGQVPVGGTGDFFKAAVGSGDIPVSTLPMALNIALLTVGIDLLPVQNAKGPWALLSYMDFPYAGGKLGRNNEVAGLDGRGEGAENKPLYFKVVVDPNTIAALRKDGAIPAEGDAVAFKSASGYVRGTFKGLGKMDGGLICQIISAKADEDPDSDNISLVEAFATPLTNVEGFGEFAAYDWSSARVDFTQTMVDFVPGFANFATGKATPMTRAENETGTGNVIGLRLFSKWVQMGSWEVTGTVTRQQLQDLPLYGVDAISKVMEALQNEITQHINNDILTHVRALGVTNAVKQKATTGADLNLWMGKSANTIAGMGYAGKLVDIYGVAVPGDTIVADAEVNTSAENLASRQRRIASRILAAANLINVTGRRGRATWVITNAKVATALQDCNGYVIAPMANTMDQTGAQNFYMGGTLAGLKVYVDPYQAWDDCRVTVGRKGTINEPGAIFMPYILADTVSITAEGTMAPKVLVNSRYTVASAGFYPEAQYLTFVVGSEFDII